MERCIITNKIRYDERKQENMNRCNTLDWKGSSMASLRVWY